MSVEFSGQDALSLLLNTVVIVIGVLIKMELHDMKSRIARLEDVFIIPKRKD